MFKWQAKTVGVAASVRVEKLYNQKRFHDFTLHRETCRSLAEGERAAQGISGYHSALPYCWSCFRLSHWFPTALTAYPETNIVVIQPLLREWSRHSLYRHPLASARPNALPCQEVRPCTACGVLSHSIRAGSKYRVPNPHRASSPHAE